MIWNKLPITINCLISLSLNMNSIMKQIFVLVKVKIKEEEKHYKIFNYESYRWNSYKKHTFFRHLEKIKAEHLILMTCESIYNHHFFILFRHCCLYFSLLIHSSLTNYFGVFKFTTWSWLETGVGKEYGTSFSIS